MSINSLQSASALYEDYKKFTTLHKDYLDSLKEKVTAIIIKKRLVSCMNTTKWLKLQNAVQELAFPPAYIIRCVTDQDDNPEINKAITALEKEPQWWIGNWSNYYNEGMPPLFNIEWIKVRPQLSKPRGALIKPEVIDETNTFRTALNCLYIPYEEKESVFTIYGYQFL